MSANDEPIFECPICFETERDPYILPSCGHSFCKDCIEKVKNDAWLKKKGFTCSICRVKCANVHEIKKNYALIELKNRANKKRLNEIDKRREKSEPNLARIDKSEQNLSAQITMVNEAEVTPPPLRYVKLKFSNGDRYEGEVRANSNYMHGKGTYFYSNGDRYEGDWLNDNQTGKGVYYWRSGDRYEGDYVRNKKNGYGVYYYANGEKYDGEWTDDLKQGYGKMNYINGDEYKGTFVKDKKHGFGIYTCGEPKARNAWYKTLANYIGDNLDESTRYAGSWENDKRTGYGQLWMLNGNRYEGDFLNGKKNGKGVLYYKSGDKYVGDWLSDSITGKGMLYWKNGERFEGVFKNGNLHGYGTFYLSNGRILQGYWDKNNQASGVHNHSNVFVQNEHHRERLKKSVSYFMEDGTKYEGEHSDDTRMPYHGKLYWQNGDVYEGEFLNGKMTGNGRIYNANNK